MIGMNQLIPSIFGETTVSLPNYYSTEGIAANIMELDENSYVIQVRTPGYTMDDLDIELHNNILKIKGTPPIKEKVKYQYTEFLISPFTRTFRLKEHSEVTKAELKHGILNIYTQIQVPEELQPKKIAIMTE